jgi:HEAT repeat protein
MRFLDYMMFRERVVMGIRICVISSLVGLISPLVVFGVTACSYHKELPSGQTNYATNGLKESNTSTAHYPSEDVKRIQVLISSLSSSEDNLRVGAQRQLIELAQTSPDRRKLVIQEILRSVGEHGELDGKQSVLKPTIIPYWRSVTEIVAELKAGEAIDALIKCIHCGNGYSGSLGEQSAAHALWRMGAMAVPKLSEALLNDTNAYKRAQIVLCLSRIGGPQARDALKRASRSETDRGVLDYIERALSPETNPLRLQSHDKT